MHGNFDGSYFQTIRLIKQCSGIKISQLNMGMTCTQNLPKTNLNLYKYEEDTTPAVNKC